MTRKRKQVFTKKILFYLLFSLIFLLYLKTKIVFAWFAEYSIYDYLSWSANGKKLVFEDTRKNEGAGGIISRNVIFVNITTGEKTKLTHPVKTFSVSDNGKILVNNDWIFNLENPQQQKQIFSLTEHDRIRATTWSPDKSKLAYIKYLFAPNTDEIGIINPDGSNKVILIKDIYYNERGMNLLIWHPKMNQILFPARGDTNNDGKINYYDQSVLWCINLDGTDKKQLTNQKVDSVFYVAAGEKIVFLIKPNIWIMEKDGSNKKKFINTKAEINYIVLSPDGKKIAYVCNNRPPYQIWVIDVDGKKKNQLTTQSLTMPCWSPDSSKIAFVSKSDTNGDGKINWDIGMINWERYDENDIWTVNSNGTNLKQITKTRKRLNIKRFNPKSLSDSKKVICWSMDSSKIIFIERTDTNRDTKIDGKDFSELWTVSLKGKKKERLTNKTGINYQWFNKRELIYIAGDFLISLNTKNKTIKSLIVGNGGEPDWSPDGKKIAFSSNNGIPNIWLIDLESWNFRQLTTNGGNNPVWSKDSKKIAFIHNNELLIVNKDGTGQRKLLPKEKDSFPDLKKDKRYVKSPNGEWVAFIENKTKRGYPYSEIWIKNSDGTQTINIVKKNTNF